jgi:hypothetical protein
MPRPGDKGVCGAFQGLPTILGERRARRGKCSGTVRKTRAASPVYAKGVPESHLPLIRAACSQSQAPP